MWAAFSELSILVRVLTVLAAVGTVSGAVYGVYSHIDSGGYDRCVGEYRDAHATATSDNHSLVIKTENKYDQYIKDLGELQTQDSPVGPYTSAAFNRLR